MRYAAFSRPGLTNLVRIEGTSTIHNGQVEGHLIGGRAELGEGFPTRPGVKALPGVVYAKVSVFLPVRSLKRVEKSGRACSDAMTGFKITPPAPTVGGGLSRRATT